MSAFVAAMARGNADSGTHTSVVRAVAWARALMAAHSAVFRALHSCSRDAASEDSEKFWPPWACTIALTALREKQTRDAIAGGCNDRGSDAQQRRQ
jgi:hypothetical protein